MRRFKQLHRIPVRIVELDLLAARPGLHLVAKAQTGGPQLFNLSRKVGNLKNDPVPSARLLKTAWGESRKHPGR